MNVKFVPSACYSGLIPQKFYQYTVIDEASRERFIFPYMGQSSYSTVDFLKRAIVYFGYKPQVLQTNNGAEFTHLSKTDRTHPLNILCKKLGIVHKQIRPRTPRHNGKEMKRYLNRSNNIPMQVLGWKSPLKMRLLLKVE